MAIYDTRYGLTQPIVNYLNQALPNISNIFGTGTGITSITPTPTATATTAPVAGLTPEQLALLYPQVQTGGGRDDRTGFGLFGNLDKSDVRYEVVDGELIPTYRNVTSGLYQTEEGKNVRNLGIELPGSRFVKGIFGLDTTPQYPGYFQQDPSKRGGIMDYLTGKTRRDAVRIFQAEQRADTGVEDPSDYTARQDRKKADAARAAALREFRNTKDRPSKPSRQPDYSNVRTGGGSPGQRARDTAANKARTSSRVSGGKTKAYGL